MRTWALLTALLMAGCAVPPEASEPIPREGWCPSWVAGPGSDTLTVRLDTAAPLAGTTLAPPGAAAGTRNGTGWEHQGHPVDLYHITVRSFTSTAQVELRAFGGDNHTAGVDEGRLFIRDYRLANGTQLRTSLELDKSAEGRGFDIVVNSLSYDDAARPGPVHLEWRLLYDPAADYLVEPQATVNVTATYFYRVCGT